MGRNLPDRVRSPPILLVAAFFALILIFSIFVSSSLPVPLASAQYTLPAYAASDTLSSTFSEVHGNPFLDPINGNLINQYTGSQTYVYQDLYQVPTSPTQALSYESLPVEEPRLPPENSLVDFTAPETTISSIMDGNNAQLQEGATTISDKAVLTIQGTDDVAVIGFQCVLDNLQQDPSICGTNPIVAENLQPGPHLFQISSVDSFGNIDNTPAVFTWNVAFSDQHIAGQQASQQFKQEQLPIHPLQQQLPILQFQEEMMLPYQTNISPYVTAAPAPSNNTTNIYENPQTLQPLLSQSFQTASPILVSPQYSFTDQGQNLDTRQSQYQQNLQQQQPPPLPPLQPSSQNISSLQHPSASSSFLPFPALPFDYPQLHQQQIAMANKSWNSGSGQNQSLAPLNPESQNNQLEVHAQVIPARTSQADNLTSRLDSNILPNSASNISANIDPELLLQSNLNETTAPLLEEVGEKIHNQYIVVLKNRLVLPSEVAAEAQNRGASILNIYDRVLNGFAMRVPNERILEAIQRNPNVAYIEPDMKVEAFAQVLPRGVNRVDGDLSSTISGNGAGNVNADIAILDTGIQLSHPDLTVYRQITFVSGTSSANDDNGHGTHVAGIAAAKDNSIGAVGVAPGARLWAVKVLGSSGSGSISTIIKGIDYVTQNAGSIDVVNMSLGCECTSSSLNTAISNSVRVGVTYVVAAGNSGKNAASFSPANHPSVIAVSAIVDTDGKCGRQGVSASYGGDDGFASFSNHGSVVDMAAPGVSIYSTYKGSTYTTLSGTSMAAPHIAGAAAIYESLYPPITPSQQLSEMQKYGSKPSTICDGRGHGYFYGDPDVYREPLLWVNPY